MMQRKLALRAAFCLGLIAVLTAPVIGAPSLGFVGIDADEFEDYFNKWAVELGMDGRLKSRFCTDEMQRICIHTFRSIMVSSFEASDGKGIKTVSVTCARECVLPDVISAVAVCLRILAPREPPKSFGGWVKGATDAAEAQKAFEIVIGPVRIGVPWLDGKETIVFLTPKADGAYDKPLP